MNSVPLDVAVILAGGSGTRLFPLSSPENPKQFVDIGTGSSLLRQTIERLSGIASTLIVVTHASQKEQVKEASRGMAVHILGEPTARNTGPAIGLALAWMQNRGLGDATILVAPSDHLIVPVEAFYECVKEATDLAREGYLVTFGMPVAHPHTGYGYIETSEKLAQGGFTVRRFTEKPDHATAVEYQHSGRHFWNGGIFVFRHSSMQQELAQHAPGIVSIQEQLRVQGMGKDGSLLPDARKIYDLFPHISIDYAVMEKSRRVAMIVSRFHWSDVGDWDEVIRLAQEGMLSGTTVEGGVQLGEAPLICSDSKDIVVHSDTPVIAVGVSDLCIVSACGYILVMQRGNAQKIKPIATQLLSDE